MKFTVAMNREAVASQWRQAMAQYIAWRKECFNVSNALKKTASWNILNFRFAYKDPAKLEEEVNDALRTALSTPNKDQRRAGLEQILANQDYYGVIIGKIHEGSIMTSDPGSWDSSTSKPRVQLTDDKKVENKYQGQVTRWEDASDYVLDEYQNYDNIIETFIDMDRKETQNPLQALRNGTVTLIHTVANGNWTTQNRPKLADIRHINKQIKEFEQDLVAKGVKPSVIKQMVADKNKELKGIGQTSQMSSLDFETAEGQTLENADLQPAFHGQQGNEDPVSRVIMKENLDRKLAAAYKQCVRNLQNNAPLRNVRYDLRELEEIVELYDQYQMDAPARIDRVRDVMEMAKERMAELQEEGQDADITSPEGLKRTLLDNGTRDVASEGRMPKSLEEFALTLDNMRGQTWQLIPHILKIVNYKDATNKTEEKIADTLSQLNLGVALPKYLKAALQVPQSSQGQLGMVVLRRLLDAINLQQLTERYGIASEELGGQQGTITSYIPDEILHKMFTDSVRKEVAQNPEIDPDEAEKLLSDHLSHSANDERFKGIKGTLHGGLGLAMARRIKEFEYGDKPWEEISDHELKDIALQVVRANHANSRDLRGFNAKKRAVPWGSQLAKNELKEVAYILEMLKGVRNSGGQGGWIFPDIAEHGKQQTRSAISPEQVRKIKQGLAQLGHTPSKQECREMGRALDVAPKVIYDISTGRTYNNVSDENDDIYVPEQGVYSNPPIENHDSEVNELTQAQIVGKLIKIANVLDNSMQLEIATFIDGIIESLCQKKIS